MEAPGSRECSHALAITFSTCKELGVPLAMDKVVGPVASLTFLGIRLCSSPLSVWLPREKVCTDVQTLELLVGHLVHATKGCPLTKPFLGRLFQVLRGTRPGHSRRLNVATRADLARWHSLLSYWPGCLHTPVLGAWATRRSLVHRCVRVMGIRCLDVACLASSALACRPLPVMNCFETAGTGGLRSGCVG